VATDDLINLNVNLTNSAQIEQALAAAVKNGVIDALSDVNKVVVNELRGAFAAALSGSGLGGGAALFQNITNAALALDNVLDGVGRSADALGAEFQGISAAVATMNATLATANQNLNALLNGLTQIVRNSSGVTQGFINLGQAQQAATTRSQAFKTIAGQAFVDAAARLEVLQRAYEELNNEIIAAGDTATAAQRQQFKQRLLALDQNIKSERDIVRRALDVQSEEERQSQNERRELANNSSRERVEILRAESRQAVVQQQTSGAILISREKANAAARLAIQKASVRALQQVFRFALDQAQAFQRTLLSAFRTLVGGVSSAVNGIINALPRLSLSFSRNSRVIRQSNQDIVNSTSSSLSRQERIVSESYSRQESVVRKFADSAKSSLGGLSSISGGGLGALAGIAAGGAFLGNALQKGFNRVATIEEATRGLTVLLGDAAQAGVLLDNVLNVVRGTPFSLDQFAQAAAKLTAFSVEAEKIPTLLTAIGDVAALQGGNAGEFVDRLTLVFGQVQTQGRISNEEINRLAEAGVNALQILGNAYGKTVTETKKFISTGAVPAGEAIDILTKGILEGTDGVNGATKAFAGLSKGLGNTLRGSIANFGAAQSRLGAAIIKPFSEGIIVLFQTLTAVLDQVSRGVASLANSVANSGLYKAAVAGVKFIGDNVKAIVESLTPLWVFLEGAIKGVAAAFVVLSGAKAAGLLPKLLSGIGFALRRVLTPFNILVGVIGAVAGAVQLAAKNYLPLGVAFDNLRKSTNELITVIGKELGVAITSVAELASGVFGKAVEGIAFVIGKVLTPIIQTVADIVLYLLIPQFKEFAEFVRKEVVPVVKERLVAALTVLRSVFGRVVQAAKPVVAIIGQALAFAAGKAKDALNVIVKFVQQQIVPIFKSATNSILIFASTIGLAFTIGFGPAVAVVGALTTALVLLQRNTSLDIVGALRPALEGLKELGAGVQALLQGDTSKLGAGFSALGQGLKETFSNIGAAIASGFKTATAAAGDFLSNLFSDDNIERALKGVLTFVSKAGEILGRIASDPRLFQAVAVVAAVGLAVAGAFLKGFAEGVVANIPGLLRLLEKGIKLLADGILSALKAGLLSSLPQTLAVLTGGAALALLVRGWSKAGKFSGGAYGTGFFQGAGQALSGIPQFFRVYFGGASVVAAQEAKKIANEFRFLQRELQRLGQGGLARGVGGRFLPQTAENVELLRQRLATVKGELGQVGSAALRFKANLDTLRNSLKLVGVGVRELAQRDLAAAKSSFRVAFSGIGQIVTDGFNKARADGVTAGRALGTLAGSAAGAALSATLVAESDSIAGAISGLSGVVGSIAAAAVIPGIGPALAAVTAGVAGLSFVLGRNAKAAKEAKAAMEGYQAALDGATTAANKTEEITNRLIDKLKEENNTDVADLFVDIGLKVDDVAEAFASGGDGVAVFGEKIVAALRAGGADVSSFAQILATTVNKGGRAGAQAIIDLRKQFEGAGLDFDVFSQAASLLKTEFDGLTSAIANNKREAQLRRDGLSVDGFNNAVTAAKTVFNQLQTDVVRAEFAPKFEAASSKIEEVRDSLNRTRQALMDLVNEFLSPAGIEQAINKATAALPGFESAVNAAVTRGGTIGQAEREEAIQGVFAGIAGALQQGFANNEILDPKQAGRAVYPFLDALWNEVEIPEPDKQRISDQIIGLINSEDLAASLEEFRNEIPKLGEALEEEGELKIEFNLALNEAGAVDAENEAAALALAEVEAFNSLFEQAGKDLTTGLGSGIAAPGAVAVLEERAREIARRALEEVKTELITQSPSKATQKIGVFFTEGFALGIAKAGPTATKAANQLSKSTLEALAGIGTSPLFAAGTNLGKTIGQAIAQGIADGADISSVVSNIVTSSVTGALTEAQSRALAVAQTSAQLFGQVGQTGIAGGRPVIDVGNARGQVTSAFGGVSSAVEQANQAAVDAFTKFWESGGNINALNKAQQEALQQFGKSATLDLTTAAGVANRSAIVAAGEAIKSYGQTLLESGRSASSVVKETKDLRNQLIEQAFALGFNGEQVAKLLRELGLSDEALDQFVKQVGTVKKEASKKVESAEEKKKREEDAEKQAEAIAKAFAQQQALDDPRFQRNVIENVQVVVPYGDPQAVALATANRLAFSTGRR